MLWSIGCFRKQNNKWICSEEPKCASQGRQHYIKNEYSSKMKEILKHQVRTYIGVIYDTGDLVYSKQKDSLN